MKESKKNAKKEAMQRSNLGRIKERKKKERKGRKKHRLIYK